MMATARGRRTALKAAGAALLACVAPAAAGQAPAARPMTIGYVQAGEDTEWRRACSASIKAAAAREHVTLAFADAGLSQESQIQAIRAFIARKVDLIAFSPVAEAGWDAVLYEARAARIPVILTGSAIAAGNYGLYASLLGPDFVEEGRRAGRWLAAQAAKAGAAPAPVSPAPGALYTIAELQGPPGSLPATARSSGFAQAVASLHPVLHARAGEDTRERGRQATAALLRTGVCRLNALFAHSDELALGAIQAIEEAGLAPGRDILVLSIGGARSAIQAMAAGKLNAAVECNPLLGPQLMQMARDIVAGKNVPRWVQTTGDLLTADAMPGGGARREPQR